MQRTGGLYFEGGVDVEKLYKEIDRMNREIKQTADNFNREGGRIDDSFKLIAKAAGAYLSIDFAGRMAREISSVRGQWQVYESVLTNTLGSNMEAAESLDMIAKYGARTNFQVNELTDSYVKLVNQGFKPTREQMESLGDLAASKGKGFEQLTEAIIDAETLEFERLKEFGVRASKNGEQITFTFKGIKTTVDATAESIRNYILSLGQLKGVQGSTEAISKTIIGLASNFQDAVDQMMNSIGRDNEGAIASTIKTGTALVQNYEQVIDVLKVLVATYGTYKAASIASVVLKEVEATGSLAAALRRTAVAQAFLNTAQKASPVGLALGAITALIGGYMLWQGHIRKTATFNSELNKEITDEVLKLDSLFKSLKSTGEGTKQRADAIKLVNERYSDYLGNLLTEKSTLEEIEAAQRNATNALIANISVQKSKDKLSEELGKISDKFDKEFGDFIKKFGEVYGTDRIPEFVVAINDAIDEKIKAGGGQVERGMLEYSQIAKDVYDKFVKDISQKTGFLEYDFKSFKDSFLDFAEFKADKSGFIGQLEGMIAAYQGIVNKFKKEGSGGSGGTGTKEPEDLKKQITDLYKKLETADEEDRRVIAERIVALEKERLLRKQIVEEAIKAVRNDEAPGKLKPIQQNVFSGNVEPIKKVNAEFDKLNKKIDEGRKKAGKMQDALDAEKLQKTLETTQEIAYAVASITDKYAEQLGLTEEQNEALQNGLNAMSGIADIASGNVIQGAAKLVDSMMGLFLKTPEKLSEHYENVQKQVEKMLNSVSIASESLSNLNVDSSVTAITILKSQLTGLADEAKNLNEALVGHSYEQRRESYSSVLRNIVKEAADLNKEIEALSERLLKGGLSTEQRDAIEAVLQSYNSLISEMNNIIADVTGVSIDDLKNSLANAFFEAEDAAKSWGDTVNDIIANIAKNQLIAKLLTEPVNQAVNTLLNDFSDGTLSTGDIKRFQDAMTSLYSTVTPAFEEAMRGLESLGIDFGSKQNTQKGLTGISASLTEETGSLLNGQVMGMRIDLKNMDTSLKIIAETNINHLNLAQLSINHLANIERNTSYNIELVTIRDQLITMNRTLKDNL